MVFVRNRSSLARLGACTLTTAALVVGAASLAPNDALADITTLEQERDAANARADEAAAAREDAAARAQAAESQRDAANASAETTQMQLADANARLDELFAELEIAKTELGEAVYNLDQTRVAIADLEDQIAKTEAELASEQEDLGKQVSSAYKGGPAHLLEIVLDATSFDDFVSRVLYANKVTEQFTYSIEHVKATRDRLNDEKAQLRAKEKEQVELVAIQEEKEAAAEQAEAAQEAFVNSLSNELIAQIEAARIAEAEAALARAQEIEYANAESQAREEAAERQRQADSEREAEARRAAEEQARRAQEEALRSQGLSTSAQSVDVAPYVSSAATGDQRSIAVNAALSQVGLPYIWGEELPGIGFDCNSLTHWAWSQAGVSIPYPSGTYAYGQFQWLKSSGHWVYSESELQPGDLVFYSHNGGANCYHVAMYLGGGQVVHAHSYRLGVTVTSIDICSGFCGGGSPI